MDDIDKFKRVVKGRLGQEKEMELSIKQQHQDKLKVLLALDIQIKKILTAVGEAEWGTVKRLLRQYKVYSPISNNSVKFLERDSYAWLLKHKVSRISDKYTSGIVFHQYKLTVCFGESTSPVKVISEGDSVFEENYVSNESIINVISSALASGPEVDMHYLY